MKKEFFGKKAYTVQKDTKNNSLLVSTWKGLNVIRPLTIETPSSINEVQSLIKKAITKKQKVKAIGAGHSFTPVAVIEDGGMLISLEKMDNIIELGSNFITVQAGCTLAKIVAYLKKHNKQLPACPEFGSFQAGAFSGTQLHDSSGNINRCPTLSSHVTKYKIVKADGSCITVESDLEYWRNNQGLGGIVVEATFRIMPIDHVIIEYEIMQWDDYWPKRHTFQAQYNEFFIIYIPVLDAVLMDKRKYVESFPSTQFLSWRIKYGSFIRKTVILNWFTQFYSLMQYLPLKIRRALIRFGVNGFFRFFFTKKLFFAIGADRGVPIKSRPFEIYNDFMFNKEIYPDAIHELKEFIRASDRLAPAMLMASYEVAKDTSCFFSRTLDGNGYSIDPVLYSSVGSAEHIELKNKIKEIAFKYKSRPHLNKVVNLSAELIGNGYDKNMIQNYLAWYNQMDPEGMFQGEFYHMLMAAKDHE
jgi:hypothetical protein